MVFDRLLFGELIVNDVRSSLWMTSSRPPIVRPSGNS